MSSALCRSGRPRTPSVTAVKFSMPRKRPARMWIRLRLRSTAEVTPPGSWPARMSSTRPRMSSPLVPRATKAAAAIPSGREANPKRMCSVPMFRVPVCEALPQGQLEHLLGPWREGRRPRAGGGGPDQAHHLLATALEVDARRRQRPGRDPVALADQPQQEVLGADEGVPQQTGLLLGQDQDPAGPVGEALEHRTSVPRRPRCRCGEVRTRTWDRRSGSEPQRFCQLGARFSANARGPSLASSLLKTSPEISDSIP